MQRSQWVILSITRISNFKNPVQQHNENIGNQKAISVIDWILTMANRMRRKCNNLWFSIQLRRTMKHILIPTGCPKVIAKLCLKMINQEMGLLMAENGTTFKSPLFARAFALYTRNITVTGDTMRNCCQTMSLPGLCEYWDTYDATRARHYVFYRNSNNISRLHKVS